MTPPTIRLFVVAALLVSVPAAAKKIYRYTDASGVTHFTDVRPTTDAPVQETIVRVEHERIVTLRVEGSGTHRSARAFNRLAGPAEVELTAPTFENIGFDPPLPLTLVLRSNEERVLANMLQTDDALAGAFELEMRAVPGDPAARPDDFDYGFPLADRDAHVGQGFGGAFSHHDGQSQYAIDLATVEGTPVLAARDGIVMQVEDDYYGNGLDREKFGGRANLVRVLHPDGSMAIYAHLQPESVVVQPGRQIRAGQALGASGNTGFSTGPHLHFAIQVNRGLRLESIPFRMNRNGTPMVLSDMPETDAAAAGR